MEAVPWLRKGTGESPADGGCVLQVVDWVHRGGWTDRPECVHPALQALAVRANDCLDDEGRQRLLDVIPRLIGTASDDQVLKVRLAVFCGRWMLPVFEAKRPGDDRPRREIEAAEAWCDNPTEENRQAAATIATIAARVVYVAASADPFGLLVAALDEYDRLTGRTSVAPVDLGPVAAMIEAAKA